MDHATNNKPSQTLSNTVGIVVCFCFLFVSFVVVVAVVCGGFVGFFSHLYIHVIGNKSSLRAHGEQYTERDIAAKLRCSKTAVYNATSQSTLVTCYMTGKGLVVHRTLRPGKTDYSMR